MIANDNLLTYLLTCVAEYKGKIEKMKLSTVYDFIREFPMLYIEASTREEIKKHTALEMQLQRLSSDYNGNRCN